MISGTKHTNDDVLYTVFKKHYCPECANRLLRKKVSKIVNSQSPSAKRYDFEVADMSIKGDMNFVHIEFYCSQCKKYYTVKEAKNKKF